MALEQRSVKPTIKELYAIRVSDKEPFVGEVIEVNDADSVVVFKEDQMKHSFVLTDGSLHLDTNKIVDIERVLLFDLQQLDQDEEQLSKLLTSEIIQDLDISLNEIKEKDIKYTEIELKEDLLSQLVYSYNAYDKYKLLYNLTLLSTELIQLTKTKPQPYRYNLLPGKSLPRWILPIVDNPVELSTSLDVSTEGNYIMNIKQLLESRRPIQPSISDVGYTTSDHTSNYQSIQMGMKRNTCHLYQHFDGDSQLIHKADMMNISGYVYLPSLLTHSLFIPDLQLSYREKSLLFDIRSHQPYSPLSSVSSISRSITDQLTGDEQVISYSIPFRIESRDVFYETIYSKMPSVENLLESLPKDIQTKLVNYHDIEVLYSVYDMDVYKLGKEDRLVINKVVSSNIQHYLQKVKPITPLSILEPPKPNIQSLSIEDKLSRILSMIFTINDIPTKNEYLQTFIQKMTRPPRLSEDPLTLYSIYTNEPILCKHYQYSSIYHKNRDAFETMMSIFGDVPQEGCIFCKHCGEYLCNEDFSQFEGFSDEQPILLREQLVETTHLLDSYKEDDVLFVKLIGTQLGTQLTDEDCHLVLQSMVGFDADKLANIRYNTRNITTSDEHPYVKQQFKQAKKIKDKKQKQKLISQFTKDFQSYLKYTNKIILTTALVMIVIQTAIPAYTTKKKQRPCLLEFTNSLSLNHMKLNKQYIDQMVRTLHKHKDSNDKQWKYYHRLMLEQKEYPLPQIKDQVISVITLLISPAYPLIVKRCESYIQFIQLSSYKYVRYEWPLYKPLLKSEVYSNVNTILRDKDSVYKPNYILNYNSYPVENVSLIELLDSSQDKLHKTLKLTSSDILTNQAFLRLFTLTVSNYGVHKCVSPRMDLTIQRLLDTLPNPQPILDILKHHKWSSSEKTKSVMYHKLRTHIVPSIIQHYLRTKSEIETCYDNEKVCNEFIHTQLNNYNLPMFRTEPKRYYSYKTFVVYPEKPLSEVDDDFKTKLKHRYCLDPTGKIIRKRFSIDYLGDMLLTTNHEIENQDHTVIEQPIKLDERMIQQLYREIFVAMPMYPFTPLLKESYQDSIVKQRISTESRYLNNILQNQILNEDHPIIQELSKQVDAQSMNPMSIRSMEDAFNTLDNETYLEEICRFIASFDDKTVKRRFESIFEFTSSSINLSPEERRELESDGYKHRNQSESDLIKLWGMFTSSDKLSPQQIRLYLRYFQSRIAELSCSTFSYDSGLPKYWRLTQTSEEKYASYITVNRKCSHRDLFSRDPIYPGYRRYTDSGLFLYIINQIKDNYKDLSDLRSHTLSSISSDTEKLFHIHLLYRFFYLLLQMYQRVSSGDTEIMNELSSFTNKSSIELEEDLQYFIMDLLLDMFEIHYDTRWTVSNLNKDELKMRLSKQKEKEKQQLIQILDTMSDEKRASTIELQNIGVISMYHTAMEMNEQRIVDEYSRIDEGDDATLDKDTVDSAVHVFNGEMNDEPNVVPQAVEEPGYYNADDIDEDGQMGDELHEFHDEDLFDSPVNI